MKEWFVITTIMVFSSFWFGFEAAANIDVLLCFICWFALPFVAPFARSTAKPKALITSSDVKKGKMRLKVTSEDLTAAASNFDKKSRLASTPDALPTPDELT